MMVDLANFLANSIKSHAIENDQSNLAKEERKILAELAGHCLPFSNKDTHGQCHAPDANDSPLSLFRSICVEPFSETLNALKSDQAKTRSMVHSICEAKSALYAVSHCTPLASDEDDGEVLLVAVSFVLEVLQYQLQPVNKNEADIPELFQKEIAMLQSGCTHFLAVCLDSMTYRKARINKPTKRTPLIEVLDCPAAPRETSTANTCTITEALSTIFPVLKSAITTGEVGAEDLYHKFYLNLFPQRGIEAPCPKIHFPPPSRIAILNSIVMLSQGSQVENGRLDWLALNLLPTLVDWASKGSADEDIRHPLCLAAALQVIYTLLARCGSFAWLSRFSNTLPSDTKFVCHALQCALRSFHSGTANTEPTVHIVRLAALKVILTVIALTQANEAESGQGLKGYLNTKEIRQAMSSLHGAANVDRNPEVRQLANQIIPYFA
mmetsp:Transcript_33255/g.69933  ORF Transcript_33255/g.69933 Transcript_33255/m.69933 type:complete len:438 (-) Transcript_33255:38-1351(-)